MDYRIGILLIALTIKYSEQCAITSDKQTCRYDLFCVNTIDTHHGWDQFRHSSYNRRHYDYPDAVPHIVSDWCSPGNLIVYGGYELDRVYVEYRQTHIDPTEAVPKFTEWSGQGIVNVIYSLNLSEDKYQTTPVLKSMQNLVILDLSKNQLTKAILSNENDLNKLSEIDLSHNTIDEIQVNSNEHPYIGLKKINISHNYLVKIPDAVFDKMPGLRILDLSQNYIEGLNTFTFEGIKNLVHLDLSNNRLTDINSSLFRFTELKHLNLGNNRIKEINATDFEKLYKLVHLDLSSNSIKTIQNMAFKNMILLNSLDLSYNNLDTTNDYIFVGLESLTSVDLSRNKFKSLPKELFKGRNIYNFSVADNLLEGSLSKGMFEGINNTVLDLSNQLLTSIEDYAFINMVRLDTLFLRDNEIQSLSNLCFNTLVNLQILDLSNNKIASISFNMEDLTSLKSLLLRNNQLVEIKHEYFGALHNLEYLDLSENAIARLESNSFNSLRNLINLGISDNPLSGVLESDTFDGLVSLPTLDISRNLLTTVKNASFNDMNKLKELNMSHCKIKELQYNAFVNTGYLDLLDLSYNQLENLFINTTELFGLSVLLLNNNLMKTISSSSLHGLSSLTKLSLANNALEGNIDNESFNSLTLLRSLDLSYNEKFKFTENLLASLSSLTTLHLSGIKTDMQFTDIVETTVSELFISEAGIHEIRALNLSTLTHVSIMVLSKNNVSKINIGDFSGLTELKDLDLSYNKISFIQPGAFKDNEVLTSLNISHNSLSVIGYGIFRGLIYLDTLDMSYNNIKDLQTERFYEVQSLATLVVDHNKIEIINAEEFVGTSLKTLSIGDNPLSCHILVKLKKKGVPFEITAIRIDEHSGENIDGITCNKDRDFEPIVMNNTFNEKSDILADIRNILYTISNKNNAQERSSTEKPKNYDEVKIFENFTNVIEKSNMINNEKLLKLANLTSRVIILNNDTNMLLAKILKALQEKPVVITTSAPIIISDNKTADLISYINRIKTELEKSIAEEKQDVINELESKLSLVQYQTESVLVPTTPSKEKLVSNNEGTKSLFTETCVGLILLILVCFVFYKFYKSRLLRRSRLSYSTRELPGAMENSNL